MKSGNTPGSKSGGLPIVGQGDLRPAQPARSIAPSPMGKRRAWVLLGVHLLIVAHIVHWRLSGETLSPVEPSEAMELSKHGVINAGAIFFAVAILSTVLFGRFFCGWGCHILALQDLCGALLKKIGIRPKPLRSRLLVWVPFLAFVYMFLWPVAYRLWIGDSLAVRETRLFTSDLWATFPAWPVALLTFGVCGFVVVYFLGQKGFCTYACPYGGIFGLVDRLSPLRIRVDDRCSGCGHCTAVCTSNVRVHEEVRDFGAVVDPGCMKCMDCVAVCPNDALSLSWGAPALGTRPRRENPQGPRYTVTGREELILGLAFVAVLFVVRGLYGVFPFLLSLGIAAIAAFLVLTTARIFYRPNLRLRRLALKRGGRITAGGRVFLASMLLGLGLWCHSAFIRWHQYRGLQAYEEVAGLRAKVMSPEASAWQIDDDERRRLERAADALAPMADRGLISVPTVELRLAWMSLLLDRDAAFEHRIERARSAGADPSVIHSLLARRHVKHQRWQEAIEEYERAVAADPGQLQPHLGLGILLAGLGDLPAASAAFERGIRRLPDEADLYYNAGLSSALSGDAARAIQQLGEALDRDPEHLAARENLAGMLAGTGRYRESLRHYSAAVLQAPSDAQTRLLKARVHLALGEREEARAEARRAFDLDPSSRQARELLDLLSTDNR